MVLSMATVANAMLTISVNGVNDPPDTSITLNIGQTAEIDIQGDGTTPSPVALWLIVQPYQPALKATMAGGGFVGTVWNMAQSTFALHTSDAQTANLRSFHGYTEFAYNTDQAYYISGMYTQMPYPNYSGVIANGMILTCTGAGDVLLSLVNISQSVNEDTGDWDAPVITPFDSQIIHQIPEPMTMALLGLGGLFLRRRK